LDGNRVAFLQIMLLAQVALCLYGTANLLLESPFLASLFWVAMGLGLRMIPMLDADRLLQRYLHAGQNTDECTSRISKKWVDLGLEKHSKGPANDEGTFSGITKGAPDNEELAEGHQTEMGVS
jgi:hypothetical protein